jgi:anti-anti-sigma factor
VTDYEDTEVAFSIETNLDGFAAVLTVQGEIDTRSAPKLGDTLDAVIDQGHRFVVLDLGQIGFMDGSGLSAIRRRAERLATSGGALTIRSPSAMVGRLLDIVGMTHLVRIEPLELEEIMVLAEGDLQTFGIGKESDPSDLSRYFQGISAIPAGDELIAGVLRLVVELARATVGGADGVSVSLRRHGQLSTVAASNQTILAMDANQYETGEGPCVDASIRGLPFHAESIDTEARWPSFTPRAKALGIHSILSSPLQAQNSPVGALNMYSLRTAAFSSKDQELASVFANQVSLILSDAGADVTDARLDERLGEALRIRTVISLAQGMLMERDDIGELEAFTTLRRFSVKSGQLLRERADDIVTSAQKRRDASKLEQEAGPHG